MIDCDRNALNGWDTLRVSNAPFTYIKWIYLCAYVRCVRGRKCKPVIADDVGWISDDSRRRRQGSACVYFRRLYKTEDRGYFFAA